MKIRGTFYFSLVIKISLKFHKLNNIVHMGRVFKVQSNANEKGAIKGIWNCMATTPKILYTVAFIVDNTDIFNAIRLFPFGKTYIGNIVKYETISV